jgi:hypothetical protein
MIIQREQPAEIEAEELQNLELLAFFLYGHPCAKRQQLAVLGGQLSQMEVRSRLQQLSQMMIREIV